MLVSVVVPALRWDRSLERTIGSVAAQELPGGVEVETVVGLAGAPPAEVPAGVRIVANPSGTTPDALNLAIADSTGEVVVRVDSRCRLAADHVARAVAALSDPDVGCVGGAQLVLDRGVVGSAYAVAFNSPLLGPSPYRYRRRSGPIDSPYLGAWRRTDLDRLGGFDPRLLRNQDNELADRVREAGLTVWYDADLVVGYHSGRSLRGAMAHHREFGAWRRVQGAQGQRSLTPRHVGALAGVAAVGLATVGALASPRGRRLVVGLGASGYVTAAVAALTTATRLRRARPDLDGRGLHPLGVALAPAVAALVDGAWVAGLVAGRRSRPVGGPAEGPPGPGPS